MCDASNSAVGDVLAQKIDKQSRVIYYASRTLDVAQENYITTEKERVVEKVIDDTSLIRDDFFDEIFFTIPNSFPPWFANISPLAIKAQTDKIKNDASVTCWLVYQIIQVIQQTSPDIVSQRDYYGLN